MFSESKALTVVMTAFLPLLCGTITAQVNYPHGNAAYVMERDSHNPVRIASGDFIYTWNSNDKQYQYGTYVLIPDLDTSENGHYIDANLLYQAGSNGLPSDTAFQWDNQVLITGPFDKGYMFVSPVSQNAMRYSTALSASTTWCSTDTCPAEINGPDSSIAWPDNPPFSGEYELWDGEELINAGDLKGTGTDSKHSQQQLDTGSNASYCVNTYGRGWRLPTDIEMGHYNDEEGSCNGFDEAYRGTSTDKYLWTCSLFKTYTVKRWPANVNNGYWENCTGFIYTPNYVRCVFANLPSSSSVSTSGKKAPTISLHPNPACKKVMLNAGNSAIETIEILNSAGQVVKTKSSIHQHSSTLLLDNLAPGLYIVRVTTKSSYTIQKKLIIKP